MSAPVELPVFRAAQPVVSICIPMLNEIDSIEACLDGFENGSYPTDRLDVMVVDGGSTDGSRCLISERAAQQPWIRLLENPAKKAAAAFNVGLRAARGEVLCLFSAHGVPGPDYVSKSVRVLAEGGVAGVCGRYLHEGTDPASASIGLAMVSPFGMASPHRFASTRQEVDTVSHPAYLMSALDGIGEFDDTLERNSDYEFNWRIRATGGILVFDPGIDSIYRPRPSLRALARQFWWYGRWKKRVIDRHPGSRRARHLVPPAAVVLAALSPLILRWRLGRRLVAGGLASYAVMLAVAVTTAEAKPGGVRPDLRVLVAAFPVMHFSWGAGVLASMVEDRVLRGADA